MIELHCHRCDFLATGRKTVFQQGVFQPVLHIAWCGGNQSSKVSKRHLNNKLFKQNHISSTGAMHAQRSAYPQLRTGQTVISKLKFPWTQSGCAASRNV
jgi:hypothetical protein